MLPKIHSFYLLCSVFQRIIFFKLPCLLALLTTSSVIKKQNKTSLGIYTICFVKFVASSFFFKIFIRKDFTLYKNMKIFSMFYSIFYSIEKLCYLSRICFYVWCEIFIFWSQVNSGGLSQYHFLNNQIIYSFLIYLKSHFLHILNWHIYIDCLLLFQWPIHLFLCIFAPFLLPINSDFFFLRLWSTLSDTKNLFHHQVPPSNLWHCYYCGINTHLVTT